MKSKIRNLVIEVEGNEAIVRHGKRTSKLGLRKQQILVGIEKVLKDPREIKGIEVKIAGATFSTTRQVVTAVNTLAWALGVEVNGKKQMSATYSGQPNITKPHRKH